MVNRLDALRLMLVTQKQDSSIDHYIDWLAQCAQAGITAVQLREKTLKADALWKFGQALKALLTPLNIPLIINDDVELAYALDAEGVHLGQTDGDIYRARQRLGSKKIIGLSVNTEAELLKANPLPIDYMGIGAVFQTTNKKDIATVWGCERLSQAALLSQHPIVAIGGITASNLLSVLQTGVQGVAAIGAFHDASDPISYDKAFTSPY